jgi:predicted Zn-dependent protease
MKHLESNRFEHFAKKLFSELTSDEEMTLNYNGEQTLFTRLSKAKIRQTSHINQAAVDIQFIKGNKIISFNVPFTGHEVDFTFALKKLHQSRDWIAKIPEDPYLVRPKHYGVTTEDSSKTLPSDSELIKATLDLASHVDLAGVLTSGDIARGTANSKGQFHWFKSKNFYLDYSLYNEKQKAVKSLYAGTEFNLKDLKTNIEDAQYKLSLMNKDSKKVERGDYRVYLAPSAVGELLGTLSWGGLSMSAHKQGHVTLKDLWEGKKSLSPKFSLKEDFSLGLAPRFNDAGEVSASELQLIKDGKFVQFLTSTRTANEYKCESNFANDWESLRSPVLNAGTLAREDVLKKLGTGLYISDLHYLNWSDRETARVTGMTRYACFWVENGEIVCPIEDLRFDESYYKIFGSALEDLTNFQELSPATGSYFQREIGGSKTPGALVSEFKFTL